MRTRVPQLLAAIALLLPLTIVPVQRWRHEITWYYSGNVIEIGHPDSMLCGTDAGSRTTFDRDTDGGICTIQREVKQLPGVHDEIEYSAAGRCTAYRRSVDGNLWELCLQDGEPTIKSRKYTGESESRLLTEDEMAEMKTNADRLRLDSPTRRTFASRYLCRFVEDDWWWPSRSR